MQGCVKKLQNQQGRDIDGIAQDGLHDRGWTATCHVHYLKTHKVFANASAAKEKITSTHKDGDDDIDAQEPIEKGDANKDHADGIGYAEVNTKGDKAPTWIDFLRLDTGAATLLGDISI